MLPCERCGRETDLYILLPIPQPDGRLNLLVCLSCAQKSDAYCTIHEMPHVGFYDGTNACIPCINAEISIGQRCSSDLLSRIEMTHDRWQPLFEWAEDVISITLETYSVIIGRAIITKAHRLQIAPDEVVRRTISEGPSYILT